MKRNTGTSPVRWMLTIVGLLLKAVLIPLVICGLSLVLLIGALNELLKGE